MGTTLKEQLTAANKARLNSLVNATNDAPEAPFSIDVYVDTANGDNENLGRSANEPKRTMAAAFSVVRDYGRIFVVGDIREELLTPLGVQGVKIIGAAGGNTRHDNGVRWREPASNPTSGGALLTIREQGWEVHNILFVPKTDGTAIRLRRAEDATYPDGSHAIIKSCKFIGNVAFGAAGLGCGVEDHGGSHHDRIEQCEFMALANGVKSTAGAGIAAPLRWFVANNIFIDNVSHIALPGNQCIIQNNILDEATTNVDTSGATGGNFVLNNQFSNDQANIAIADGYKGHATDVWRNFSQNTAAMTVGIPA